MRGSNRTDRVAGGRRLPGGAPGLPRAVATVLVLLVAGGCARRDTPPPRPDPAQDARIQRELQVRIAAEPSLRRAQLRAEVEAARVRLYGSVDGIGAWNCVLRNAWLIDGVQGVTDFLILERGAPEVACRAAREMPPTPGTRP